MAVASKLNAAAVAILLPAALGLFLLRLPPTERQKRLIPAVGYLMMAAFVSLLVFRIFQPYAFSGPGFFGLKPNPVWVDNIREQRAQSTGDVDFPPAMQWARRPVWFSLQNMVVWGFGLPLGLLAWAGFLWVGWRLLNGWKKRPPEWFSHALIWGWTALYFIWQSLQMNPTMRYQLLIYPTLTILAAWAVFSLYDSARLQKTGDAGSKPWKFKKWYKFGAILIGSAVLLATAAYAYAFTQIYLRPITRVAASRWIYQNIPGPITLPIQTETGVQNQILAFPYEYQILPELPFTASFKPNAAGLLSEIVLPRVIDKSAAPEPITLTASINSLPGSEEALTSGSSTTSVSADRGEGASESSLVIPLDPPLQLDPMSTYNLVLSTPGRSTAIDF